MGCGMVYPIFALGVRNKAIIVGNMQIKPGVIRAGTGGWFVYRWVNSTMTYRFFLRILLFVFV